MPSRFSYCGPIFACALTIARTNAWGCFKYCSSIHSGWVHILPFRRFRCGNVSGCWLPEAQFWDMHWTNYKPRCFKVPIQWAWVCSDTHTTLSCLLLPWSWACTLGCECWNIPFGSKRGREWHGSNGKLGCKLHNIPGLHNLKLFLTLTFLDFGIGAEKRINEITWFCTCHMLNVFNTGFWIHFAVMHVYWYKFWQVDSWLYQVSAVMSSVLHVVQPWFVVARCISL